MKKLIYPALLFGALVLASFSLQTPNLKFDNLEHDFGKIPQGEPVKHKFTFTNDGSSVLILTDVKASCGCTTPTWPQEPIMPGQTGVIEAEYNAAADGVFDKTITVYSNAANKEVVLKLKGVVEKTSKVLFDEEEGPVLQLGK
jgi:hypothetical protein